MKNKICLIGPSFPPIGGVSIYIQRLIKKYRRENIFFEHIHFTGTSSGEKLERIFLILFDFRIREFQINSGNINVLLIFLFRFLPSRIIYYDHNFRKIENWNRMSKLIFKIFLKRINELWVVESNIKQYYIDNGFKLPENVSVRNAYIPPEYNESSTRLFFEQNVGLSLFIRKHNPLIYANASSLEFYNGIDLYGFDLMIELVKRLVLDYSRVGLVLVLGSDSNHQYVQKLKNNIKQLKLEDNVILTKVSGESWPLLGVVDLFIRPTNTDGDSISIRESLDMKCNTMASDCVSRPSGCITFKNRDLNDLLSKVKEILSMKHLINHQVSI